jgi:putative chitinase
MITAAQLKLFAPRCDAEAIAPALDAAAFEAGCTTPLRVRQFLAQWSVESAGFTRLVESLNYAPEALLRLWPRRVLPATAQLFGRTGAHPADQTAIANTVYGGRMGNVGPGDGWRFRGRGWAQLTGRANYAKAGLALGLDLVDDPDQAATPEISGRVCAWYWTAHDLNAAADRDDLEAVTRGVNGGLNGLGDRRAALERARAIWGA